MFADIAARSASVSRALVVAPSSRGGEVVRRAAGTRAAPASRSGVIRITAIAIATVTGRAGSPRVSARTSSCTRSASSASRTRAVATASPLRKQRAPLEMRAAASGLAPRPRARAVGGYTAVARGRLLPVTAAADERTDGRTDGRADRGGGIEVGSCGQTVGGKQSESWSVTAASAALDGAGGAAAEAPKSAWYGRALLIFVAAAYGSLSVAFKYVYSMPGPPSAGTIGAVRGVMAALCFIPMLLKEKKAKEAAKAIAGDDAAATPGGAVGSPGVGSKKFWMAAAELALWNLSAQGACNVALLFTDATRVSFLTQASIAFTPVLVSASGDKVPAITWAGCLLAILGVVALGFDGGGGSAAAAAAAGLNVGDVIALFGAASYSLYIFRISTFGRQGLPGNLTQAWKTVILAVLYLGWAAADVFRWMSAPALVAAPWAGWANPLAWAVLAFSAVVPGYLADVCQAKGQETVNASESQVLLAGEPLFAAVFGAVLLGETLGKMGYLGGAGLVLGAVLAGMDGGGGGTDDGEESEGAHLEEAGSSKTV